MRFSGVLGLVLTGAFLQLGAGPSSASAGDTVVVGGMPIGVVVGADGTAYIGNSYIVGVTSVSGGVSVLAAGTSNPPETLNTGYGVAGLAISSDGTIYAEGWDSATRQELISVFPRGAHLATRTIPVTPGAHLIAAAPDGTLYVPNYGSGTVSVIPPGADAAAREIAVGAGPREVAVALDGTAYVTNQDAGTVSVIPAGSPSVSHTIPVSSAPDTSDNPHGIAIGPDGSVYVAEITGNAVAVVRPGGTTVAYRVPVPGGPKEVAVGADGTVYALSTAQGLSVIRPGGTAVALSLKTANNPGHLAVVPNGSVIITNSGDGTVSVLGPEMLQPAAATAAPTAQPQAATASGQVQSTDGSPALWGNLSIALGAAVVLVLAATAAVIMAGRRRRRPATHEAAPKDSLVSSD